MFTSASYSFRFPRPRRGVLPLASLAFAVAFGHQEGRGAQLDLSWTDNSDGQAAFAIERKAGTAGTFAEIGQQPPAATSYTDLDLTSGATYCYRVRAFNEAGYSPYSNEACGSPSPGFDLTVATAGTGSGTVASTPTGINCGSDCFESYAPGTVVILTATAVTGSVFSGWTGSGCTGTDPCVMAGSGPVTVTATFSSSPSMHVLTATTAGSGLGSISSSPVGITCPVDCSEPYAADTVVTLSAVPGTGATFGGWSGACLGTGACTVTMTAAKSVTATFNAGGATTYSVTIGKAGTGTGTVTSSPPGITCGADCSEAYPKNTVVTLTATPAPGSVFTGWTGQSGCEDGIVQTYMDRSCTANFAAIQTNGYTVTVSTAGTGTGTVTSSPAGITCGADCSEAYPKNTVVTLTATPAPGSVFTGWTGQSGCEDGIVQTYMDRFCTANFALAN